MLEKTTTTDAVENKSVILSGIQEYDESNIYFRQIDEQNNGLTLNKNSNTDAVGTTSVALSGIHKYDAGNIDCKETTIVPNECVMLEKTTTKDAVESNSVILSDENISYENIIESSSEEIISNKIKNRIKRSDYQQWTNIEMQAIKRQLSVHIVEKKPSTI